ncbi:phage portal protein [Dactylosporangium sp. CS-033363]|uniref:phage portal protein n=1 Tax=Dactylosporangium sp. CS-033363 TaxID=3239935 RepID=UPI003D93118B
MTLPVGKTVDAAALATPEPAPSTGPAASRGTYNRGLPPGGNTPWPPPERKHAMERFLIWRAWYRGDPEEIAATYGGGGSAQLSERRFTLPGNHPAQYRGGVVGAVARAWWGKPIPQSDYPSKMHIPAPEDLAVVSSQLLFSEPPQIKWEDEKTAKRMSEVLNRSKFHAKLLQGGEVQAAYGGVYMVITWDDELAGHPWIRPVLADAAVPEFAWDILTAVTFADCVQEEDAGQTVWRHLERHERGRILHGLYKGSKETLGQQLPLTAHPKTARLQPQIETVKDRLTVAYIPNLLPNRLDPGSVEGRSDFSPGMITLFDALDQTYTSLMNDLELGEAKLVVPRSYLKSNGPGQGMRYDHSQRIFLLLDMLDSPERPATIEQVQFTIRVAEHLQLAGDIHDQIVRAAGYAKQGVMGDESNTQATATEVNVRNTKSDSTRDAKALYWAEMATLLETLALLDGKLFGSGITAERPDVTFNEEQQTDPLVLGQVVQALYASESASIETRVRMAHPSWPKDQIDAEVEKVTKEFGTTMDKQKPPPGMGPIGAPAGNPGTNPMGTPRPRPNPQPGTPGGRPPGQRPPAPGGSK